MKILMVCLGNICRSPLAEAILRKHAAAAGVDVEVDSAGTAAYHIGKPADPRGVTTAQAHGYDNTSIARQVTVDDFDRFDLLIAMDTTNQADLIDLAPDADAERRVRLFRDYAGEPGQDVPDPYYGGQDGFDDVIAICQRAVAGLLTELRS